MKALLILFAFLFHGGAFAADKWCVTDQWGGETQQCGDTKQAACGAVSGPLGNWGTIIGSIYVQELDICDVTGRYNDSGNTSPFVFTLRFVPGNQCQANQSWLGGPSQITKIGGPDADYPTKSCFMGCEWNEGSITTTMKALDHEGQWWAYYQAPDKKSNGNECTEDTVEGDQGNNPVKCSLGFTPDASGVCRKSVTDQTDPKTNVKDTVKADGKLERVSTTSKTVCTSTECTTTKTTTTTVWSSSVGGVGQGTPTETTETEVTTQPKGGTGDGTKPGDGPGTSDGSGFCEQNPQSPLCDSSSECEKSPDLLGCSKLTTPETVELPTRGIPLELQAGPVLSSGGGCPADVQVTVFGTQVTAVPWATGCNWISLYVRPVILLLAAISAVFIVLPRD